MIDPENSCHVLNQSDATETTHDLVARIFPRFK